MQTKLPTDFHCITHWYYIVFSLSFSRYSFIIPRYCANFWWTSLPFITDKILSINCIILGIYMQDSIYDNLKTVIYDMLGYLLFTSGVFLIYLSVFLDLFIYTVRLVAIVAVALHRVVCTSLSVVVQFLSGAQSDQCHHYSNFIQHYTQLAVCSHQDPTLCSIGSVSSL